MVTSSHLSLYHTVAELTTQRGFACIPLEPDSKRPLPKFDLSRWFTQRPSDTELRAWFQAPAAAPNIGIVCGSVSNNLFVLDFDIRDNYHDFCKRFPTLALSYTVKTKRGYHLYLRSTHAYLSSRKLGKADLKARGGYVVGAGSVVNNVAYTVTVEAPVLLIEDTTIHEVIMASSNQPRQTTANEWQKHNTNTRQLIQHYITHVAICGRNNALYKTALNAAYNHIPEQTCIDTLATLHTQTQPIAQHVPETPEKRLLEACSTIASAYHAEPRHAAPTHAYGKDNTIGIPNNIREQLLHKGKALTARLLEAFALAGWNAGKPFTMQDAIGCGKTFHIGRASVIHTLRSGICEGSKPTKNPVGEKDKAIPNSNNKPRRGKPTTRWFTVPTHAELAAACGVALGGTIDKLTAADLHSSKAYRTALHRELVRRQTPELSNEFLARRLGVCARSLRRYNTALAVIRTPIFGYEPLTWANVNVTAYWGETYRNQQAHAISPGTWLQIPDGKRYPAIRGIALRLLAGQETPLYCRRLPNRLQLPQNDALLFSAPPENTAVDEEKGQVVIWRHLSASCADWHGGAHAFPPLSTLKIAVADTPPNTPAPGDDLTTIKGIGKRWARVLSRAGLDTFEKLARVKDVEAVAIHIPSPYVKGRQVAYWVYQADLLARGALTIEELETWRYKDWKDFQFELRRVTLKASARLKRALAEEFSAHDWLRYKPVLPAWFTQLIAQVASPRLF